MTDSNLNTGVYLEIEHKNFWPAYQQSHLERDCVRLLPTGYVTIVISSSLYSPPSSAQKPR